MRSFLMSQKLTFLDNMYLYLDENRFSLTYNICKEE